MSELRFDGKVAIITGAAAGMGAATARLFAREGAKLMLTDIDNKDGPAVAADIVRTNGAARFEKHDVSNDTDWQRIADATLAAYGRIDILINNAGISGSIPDKLDLEMWDRQFSINARGNFLGIRAVVYRDRVIVVMLAFVVLNGVTESSGFMTLANICTLAFGIAVAYDPQRNRDENRAAYQR